MTERVTPPRWLGYANRMNRLLHRIGTPPGPVRLVCVPGRRTGRLHSTPVAPLVMDGRRYVIGGRADADWVANARAAGWGYLQRGRRRQRVRFVELPADERLPVLREFRRSVGRGALLLLRMHGQQDTPQGLRTLAERCPVFHAQPLDE